MPSIRYTISMPAPKTHLFDVSIDVRGHGADALDFVLPAWTPGSYKVRDYARNVQDFSAGGRPWRKVDKQTWRVETGGRDVRVRYSVYAFELNVRGVHLDEDHGYFNGAAVFMYVDGMKERPIALDIRPAPGWKVVTGLGLTGTRFAVPNYDILVDSPVECGRPEMHQWRAGGKVHRLAIHGRGNHDPGALVRDLRRITDVPARMFGGRPYGHYTFIVHLTNEAGGGLEHLNSASIQVSPSAFRPRPRYVRFLELMAHEYFHLWNVKRIHPAGLGPFDYSKEVHTTLLWAMEGVTSYYESLILRRAGVVAPDAWLKSLAEKIEAFREKPGRLRQSLSESSWDAWTKFYNPTEQTPNAQVSYYEKGALVGMLLDLEIRARSRNRASLDDALRLLWSEHGKRGAGFPDAEYRRACERVAGWGLAPFWRDYIEGTKEIDWDRFLATAGLKLVSERRKEEDKPGPRRRAWLGIVGGRAGDRLLVSSVRSGSPAEAAGLCARDEILAADGVRIDAETWLSRLEERTPGDRVRLSFFRDGALRRATATLAAKENVTLKVGRVKKPTASQRAIYESWLRSKWPRIGGARAAR